MRKIAWMGLPIVLGLFFSFLWLCIDSPVRSEPPPSEVPRSRPTKVQPPPELSEEERMARIQASIEQMRLRAIREAEEARREDSEDSTVIHASSVSRSRPRLTAVQAAPSFFPGYEFTEIASTRRRQEARFDRHAPEVELIGNDQALYDATLLVLARGFVHEANFPHRPCGEYRTACDTAADHNHAEIDGPAMYAVFRRTRATGETLLGAIRRHMRYVTEQAPPIRERSRWITELQLDGNRPTHFPETDAEGNPLDWDRDYRPRWEMTIALARELLAGHRLGPCANAPLQTWGGRCEDNHGACDDHLGSHRGLVGMYCGDSSNRFWCRPGIPGCVETDPVPEQTIEEVASVDTPSEESTETEDTQLLEEANGEPLAMLHPI